MLNSFQRFPFPFEILSGGRAPGCWRQDLLQQTEAAKRDSTRRWLLEEFLASISGCLTSRCSATAWRPTQPGALTSIRRPPENRGHERQSINQSVRSSATRRPKQQAQRNAGFVLGL